MQIELTRFLTTEDVRVEYRLPEPLARLILPVLPVAFEQPDGTRLHLESEVDQFIAELVRRQRMEKAQTNPPNIGKPGRKVETLRIAIYADELKRKGQTWKEIRKACQERWPDDDRVDNKERVRATWRRHFGPKRRESD